MGWLEHEKVHVTVHCNRSGQVEEVAAGQQGESEQDEPPGQVQGEIAAPYPSEEVGPPLGRARLSHLSADQLPEVRLPGGMAHDRAPRAVHVVAGRPARIMSGRCKW